MPFTTLTVRQDVAKRLRTFKAAGESFSDLLGRMMDDQPARTMGEWLDSLAPLEGRGVFTAEERERLKQDQRTPRDSHLRRKGRAAP